MLWRKFADLAFWLGICLYLGGMLAVGAIVAPAVFATARDTQLSMPGIVPPLLMDREVGGEIFGRVLDRFGAMEAIALALMFLGLTGWLLTHRHVRQSTWIVLALWAIVAAAAAVDAAWLRPKVWAVRTQVRQEAPLHANDLPGAAWTAREQFDALHKRSERLGNAKAYLLLAMLAIVAWRGPADRRGAAGDQGDILRRHMGGTARGGRHS